MITDHSDSGERVDGGVQAVTKYLVEAMIRRRDIELHVISFQYRNDQHRSFEGNGYKRHVLAGGKLGTLTGFRSDQRNLDALLARIQPDIVHGQGAGHNGIMAARSGFPWVITIHGIMAEEAKHLSAIGDRARHWLLSRISNRHCIVRGEHTILISPYVAEYFGSRLGGAHYLIPNPIADGFFSVPRAEIEGRVLFAGRLYHLKGVLDLVRACATIATSRPIELHLAGSLADREYVASIEREAARTALRDRVRILGLLDERQLQRELGEAAVLVLPSYQETAPMVIVEAMAAGVPVIATDVGGTRYLVRHESTGFLVRAGKPTELADRLDQLLGDDTLRDRLGGAARSLAGEDYRASRVAERTVEVYRTAIANRTS